MFSDCLLTWSSRNCATSTQEFCQQMFQFRFLSSQCSCCSTVDTVVSSIFFNFDPSQCGSVYSLKNNKLYSPFLSRLLHPAPFGITFLVGFFILPSVHLQVQFCFLQAQDKHFLLLLHIFIICSASSVELYIVPGLDFSC